MSVTATNGEPEGHETPLDGQGVVPEPEGLVDSGDPLESLRRSMDDLDTLDLEARARRFEEINAVLVSQLAELDQL